MSLSRIYIWLLCFISLQTVSGIYVNLTRVRTGDYFSNPYDDNEFCLSTDSKCYEDFPESGDECRYCICSEGKTTFGLASLRCIPNEESLNKGWVVDLNYF